MAAPRNLTLYALLLFLTVGFMIFEVDSAHAAPLPRLSVVRSDDAADCPDAVTLASAVERQMQRPALNPTSNDPDAPVYEVRIARSKDGYSATIQAGDFTRDLSDPGSTCGELADALALTLAILLDNEAPPLPTSPPAPPVPAPPIDPRPAPSRSPSRSPSLPTPPVVFSVKPPRPWHVGVDLAVGETLGFLTPLSFAFSAGAWVRYNKLSFGADFFGVPSATVEGKGQTGADSRLFAALVHVCKRLAGKPSGVHVSACGQSVVGAIHGEGYGFTFNRQGTRPWWALGAMGSLNGPLAGQIGWFLRLSVAMPIVSYRLVATPNPSIEPNPITLFEPPSFAGLLSVGLRWTIL